ncbi:ABC transporter ATP-binding protein [Roseovarius sp. HI0049]|nr:ABC transporter ATP-binding protein [Roseovarius sp. HI0049]
MNEHADGGRVLEIENLCAYYGDSQALHDVSLKVAKGEVVTLLGRNGAGKSSTLRSIVGIVQRRTGSIRFNSKELIGMPKHHVSRLGIGYVPEERGIFSSLSVAENLMLPRVVQPEGMTKDDIFCLFPNLEGRDTLQGTRLSGGEQQMLAIARILRTGAKTILLDEPTEGLAPVIIDQIGASLRVLREKGFTILLVEQNFRFAAQIADRHYIMEEGHIADMMLTSEIDANKSKLEKYLGV